jgi:hypothetical protein
MRFLAGLFMEEKNKVLFSRRMSSVQLGIDTEGKSVYPCKKKF